MKCLLLQHLKHGHVAERLGTGLQNRLQRFESARDLSKSELQKGSLFLYYSHKQAICRFLLHEMQKLQKKVKKPLK